MANPSFSRQNNQQGSRGFNDQRQFTLPDGYLNGGYFAPIQSGQRLVIKEDYIIDYPAEIAKKLTIEHKEKNKSSQLRKFYGYCLRIKGAIEQGNSFEEVKSDFFQIKNYAEYAESRGRVTKLFVDFIEKNVNVIKNEDITNRKEAFYAFVKHFEAIIANIKK